MLTDYKNLLQKEIVVRNNFTLILYFYMDKKLNLMAFDIEMIKHSYAQLAERIGYVKKKLNHPLTFSEKILYAHLWDKKLIQAFNRGEDYVNFAPDRIACQDATAQMALLQFMQAGKTKVWPYPQLFTVTT